MAGVAKRRAALLLMNLDATTASELLRACPAEMTREIAAELAYLHASGKGKGKVGRKTIQEFFTTLAGGEELGGTSFIREVLGDSKEAVDDVYDMVANRDPFLGIKSSSAEDIALALRREAPEVVAVILGELPTGLGGELLATLDPDVRERAVCCLAVGLDISRRAKMKIASAIQRTMDEVRDSGAKVVDDDTKLRQVAVLLQGLKADVRDSLVGALRTEDTQRGDTVASLMVIWGDIKRINDRCMQEILRSVDARNLALALVEVDPVTADKIRDNVSERVRDMLEEESSLLSSPKEEDVQTAREEILNGLRDMNQKGDLIFDYERTEEEEGE